MPPWRCRGGRRPRPPRSSSPSTRRCASSSNGHRAVRPDFAVDNANAPAVAEICWRLDGLPLAIELAAARVRLLPPQALLARLEKRLPLPDGRRPRRPGPAANAARRHRLELRPARRSRSRPLFRRLAVFAGGFTLEAAEAVANPDGGLDVLAAGGAAVRAQPAAARTGPGGEPRFGMLETVREFAAERLVESGEEEATRNAHADVLRGPGRAGADRDGGTRRGGLARAADRRAR